MRRRWRCPSLKWPFILEGCWVSVQVSAGIRARFDCIGVVLGITGTIFQILPRGLGNKTSKSKRDEGSWRGVDARLGVSHLWVSMRDWEALLRPQASQ